MISIIDLEGTNLSSFLNRIGSDGDVNEQNIMYYDYILGKCSGASVSSANVNIEKDEQSKILSHRALISNKYFLLECLETIDLSYCSTGEKTFVDKKLVHKLYNHNVMVSEVDLPIDARVKLLVGDINHTSEIELDHINEEHVEAILLTEVCRQSCLVGLSHSLGSESEYHILEEVRKFKKMVKRGSDLYIHVLPIIGKRAKGKGICLFTLYQNNRLCLSGYYSIIYNRKNKVIFDD